MYLYIAVYILFTAVIHTKEPIAFASEKKKYGYPKSRGPFVLRIFTKNQFSMKNHSVHTQ